MSVLRPTISPDVIVFDLGGVMAEICHTWQDAAKCAGVDCKNLTSGGTPFTAFPGFDLYQSGELTLAEYLQDLSKFIGCNPDESLRVHNGILVAEYPGILDLVRELRAKGIRTGCLSNTNPPHWEVLALTGQYPAIQLLDMKMASHLAGINKPAPEVFELYSQQFGLAPSAIAFFDDYRENVAAAAACGWNSRWIDSSIDTPTQLRAYLGELGVI